MKHLHFVQAIDPLHGGGLGTAAVALSNSLNNSGASSVVVSTTLGPTVEKTTEVLFHRQGLNAFYFSYEMLVAGKSLVTGVDVVHGHGLYVFPNALFGSLARSAGKQLVYHAHGFFDPWVLSRSRWKKRAVHRLFEDKNFRSVRWWRALTNKEADQIRALGITKPICVIPNGVSLAAMDKEISLLPKSRKQVLFLGRLHPKKGLEMLLSAWAILHPRYKGWELVVAGPDEGGYGAILRKLGEAMVNKNVLRFVGPVWGDDKNSLIASCDIFILPSFSEGMPMAVLEAMALSRPVVISEECNITDADQNGAWVCKPTPDAVIATLDAALSVSDVERQSRGKEGRDFVERHFEWGKIAMQIEDAIRTHK